MAVLSEYEKARQEKIAANQKLLNQLQNDAAKVGISKPKASINSSSSSTKRKRAAAPKVKKEEDVGPRRTSSRLKGIVADSEVARQHSEREAEAFQEAQRIKRQRFSADIKLEDAVVNGLSWDRNWLSGVGPANPGERTFDAQEMHQTSDQDVRELRERLSGLELWSGAEPNRIKITPERIYSMAFHPTEDKALVFAGDKLGSLGLFDASQSTTIKQEDDDDDDQEDFTPAISTFKIHTRTISAFQFSSTDQNSLFSASYDSSIRKLDLQNATAVEVYAPEDRNADSPLSGVQISSQEPHTLHFTTLSGEFGIKDLRAPTHEVVELFQLSDKKIGGFSLHPTHPHLVATASLDRTLKIWDLRKVSGKKSEDRSPVCVAEHTSRLSVSHAAWNSTGQVATTSYDDTIKIHDFSQTLCSASHKPGAVLSEPDSAPTTIIKHNNQTGRWVTILRAQWQAHPRDGIQKFVVGNMNRFVDVYTARGEQVAQLGGEGITAVPAVAVWHERREWIAGGTASGKLCLWQ